MSTYAPPETGKVLYEVFACDLSGEHNPGHPQWEELSPSQRTRWQTLAQVVLGWLVSTHWDCPLLNVRRPSYMGAGEAEDVTARYAQLIHDDTGRLVRPATGSEDGWGAFDAKRTCEVCGATWNFIRDGEHRCDAGISDQGRPTLDDIARDHGFTDWDEVAVHPGQGGTREEIIEAEEQALIDEGVNNSLLARLGRWLRRRFH